jgi:hypothetical protein
MEVRMKSQSACAVQGIDPVLTEIRKRLQSDPHAWLQRLKESPGSFQDLETSVHDAFRQMADQMVAGLLAQATHGDAFAQGAKKN